MIPTLQQGQTGRHSGTIRPLLLMHMDNTISSTTFTNYGSAATSFSAHGNAVLSSAHYQYGTDSLFCDGTTDWIDTTVGLDAGVFGSGAVGTGSQGDFTVECWVYLNAHNNMLFDYGYTTGGGGGWQLYETSAGKLEWWRSGTGTVVLTSSATISLTTWTHVAAVRRNGTLKLYIGGTNSGSVANTTTYDTTNVTTFAIGAQIQTLNHTYDLDGYLDEARIIRQAMYDGNFTPTGPFAGG